MHGKLHQTTFEVVPDGVLAERGIACQLLKSMYGLKLSSRFWKDDRFNERGNDAVLVLYVDDLLIIGDRQTTIQTLKLAGCGEVYSYLGMKINKRWLRRKVMLSLGTGFEKADWTSDSNDQEFVGTITTLATSTCEAEAFWLTVLRRDLGERLLIQDHVADWKLAGSWTNLETCTDI